jgi:hypothetical protein
MVNIKKTTIMKENRISMEFSDELLNQILQRIDEAYNLLPVHVSLNEDERTGGFKLGDKGVGFLEKGKDYMGQAPQFSPQYLDQTETFRDANFSVKTNTIARKLMTFQKEVEDMCTIAGMEALSGILTYYNSVKNAAKDGIPAAKPIYEDLKKRFPGPGSLAKKPDNGTTNV